MPYLRAVKKRGNRYYYLFHTIRDGNKSRRISKCVGRKKPEPDKLEQLKLEFLEEIEKSRQSGGEYGRINLIATLQEIQDKFGYLPEKELEKLSKEKGIPGTDIFGVATFYSQFTLQKPAKYIIQVCTGTACHVRKSNLLLQYLEQALGIRAGETTQNGLIKLETVNCIGACAKAPALMINDSVYGNVTNNRLTELLKNLK